MIRFCTLFSGSSGNCTFISDGDTNLLIDAGVSASKIVNSLKYIGVSPEEIDAILITHEHSDHISGVRVLSSKYSIPVYANGRTMEAVLCSAGVLSDSLINIRETGSTFEIRSAVVRSFKTPHDSAESVGYIIDLNDRRFGIATDTGCVTKGMLSVLARCEAVLLESNHDVDMLNSGKYPYALKMRILSGRGHLSNSDCAWLATQLALWGTKHIALGHLSENNNTPEKAYAASETMMRDNDIKIGSDVTLGVAPKCSMYDIYSAQ